MLTILRTRLLNPNFNSFITNLLFLQIQSPIHTFSDSQPNLSLSEKRQDNSERVKSLLKANGFTENHITRLAGLCSRILLADPIKTLAPKIDFFRSIGISNTDLPNILSFNPVLLNRSLKNHLIPRHHYLKSVLISDENVVQSLKRSWRILSCDIEKILDPNISLLIESGVPKSRIQYMLIHYPDTFQNNHAMFKNKVEEVIRLGFNPTKSLFLYAIYTLCTMTKTTFERKWGAYRNWNLSDDEIRMAFRSHPNCMNLSEEKITRGMDFLVNKMGFEAGRIARTPVVLFFNLENRIIPRCRVIQVLISKGILKKDMGLTTFLTPPETKFLEKFVSNYEDEVPGLLNIYKGKKDCLETGNGSDKIEGTI